METRWTAPVRDFMSRTLIAVRPDAPLRDVQRTFEEDDISAVPIIDEGGTLRGILSTKDLLRAARLEMSLPEDVLRISPPAQTASELMKTRVFTVEERAPIGTAGEQMLRHRVHRLVVLREGKPCAVVSTRDAMRAIVAERVKTPLADVMTRELEVIDLGEPIDSAVERLDDANVRGLIVVDGRWPVGVFTETEAMRARALPRSMRQIPVERIMSYEIVCLRVSTPIDWVANYARQLRVRRILAVEDRSLAGVATGFDILRIMAS
jgi:predicted transcriptional regulator